MAEENIPNKLGPLLKNQLKKQSLSMRKLSEQTNIDTATISRIINGKRKATPDHLKKMADCLNISISELYVAAGYPIEKNQEHLDSDIHASIDSIQNFLESSNLYDKRFSIDQVQQELTKYEQYTQTEEGKETILSKFEEKLRSVGSIGPFINHLKDMYEKFRLNKGTAVELTIIGSALLYFILPVDVIPDYIFPIGYLDDAIAVKMVISFLSLKN